MPTHKLDAVCPHCGVVIVYHDEVSDQPHRPPTTGSYAFCVYCLKLSVFVNAPMGLALRETTPEEYERAVADPRFASLVDQARQVRRKEGT
jgi:hypothetical protein